MWALALQACLSTPEAPVPAPEAIVDERAPEVVPGPFGLVPGRWSAWLATDGGPARFALEIEPGPSCRVSLVAGGTHTAVAASACEAQTLSMKFFPFPEGVTATIGPDGRALHGHWGGRGNPGLPFEAVAGVDGAPAWIPAPDGAPSALTLDAVAGPGSRPVAIAGRVHLAVRPSGAGPGLIGTVGDARGDWGVLEGGWTAEGLELSGFDGSRAALVRLAPDDTGRMRGYAWLGPGEPLELVEADGPADLDGWDALTVSRVQLGGVVLPRVGLEPVELPQQGPRVLHVMSPRSPASHDAAPILERIHQEVAGVQVFAIGWEDGVSATQAERHLIQLRDHLRVTYPLFVASERPTLLGAAEVPAWPTTVFVRGDGSVSAVHVGSAGPASRALHDALVERMFAEARALLR